MSGTIGVLIVSGADLTALRIALILVSVTWNHGRDVNVW